MEGYKDGDILPKKEVMEYLKSDYYDDEIEIIFAYHTDHPIEMVNGRIRWKQTLDWKCEIGKDPNEIGSRYFEGKMSQKEYMDYNRQIGYSLYGYWEVFVFNDRFNQKQYDIDMIQEREEKINNLI